MGHLKATGKMVSMLEADKINPMKWCVDASHAVHNDMQGHTGGTMTMGKGAIHSKSTKQKLNTKSSTKLEPVGIDNMMPQVLWTNCFVRAQGWENSKTISCQDDESAVLLASDGKLSSSSQTKHINVCCCFAKDCIKCKELEIEFCGTNDMWADFHTKTLQGKKFLEFRKSTLNLNE